MVFSVILNYQLRNGPSPYEKLKTLVMKVILFSLLFVTSFVCKSLTLELGHKDSIHYTFWGADTILYGNSATVEVKGGKFQIGVFGFYTNLQIPSKKKRGVIAVYKMEPSDRPNFFKKFDLINCEAVADLKYLIIEGEIYSISEIASNKLIIEKSSTNKESLLKQQSDFIECVYDIKYFDGKYTDSLNKNVSFSILLKKGKLNIIYYTITYCEPCERAKYEMVELSTNRKVNLNFVTESGVNFDNAYKTNQKYFYDKSQIKNGLGYPTLLLFDGEGSFIKTINTLTPSIINTIKNAADSCKISN